MLNLGAKKEALARLEQAAKRHEQVAKAVEAGAIALHVQRAELAEGLIGEVEVLVNRLASAPKEFDKAVSEFRIEVHEFQKVVEDFHVEAARVEKLAGGGTAGGVMAGAGVAMLGPAAAMGVATTFGTASTGTAIAALAGASQTSAALAWLGGGALATGGGGMAGGQAFLALAGPVGWGIGGIALLGGVGYTHVRNGRVSAQATQEAERVEAEVSTLTSAKQEIAALSLLTTKHEDGIRGQLKRLAQAPSEYALYSAREKQELGALINNVRTLGKLLNTPVKPDAETRTASDLTVGLASNSCPRCDRTYPKRVSWCVGCEVAL